MPAQHKSSFISTAEWNQVGERMRVRSRRNGAPRDLVLSALIVQALLIRFRRSSRREDKRLIELIEQLALWEDRIEVSGGDLQKELGRQHSIFDSLLSPLAYAEPGRTNPKHDALMIRIQYDMLWGIVRKHPLPTAHNPVVLKGRRYTWLTAHWKEINHLLRECPCTCEYHGPDSVPPEMPARSTPKSLFLCLLAQLHHSTPDAISQFLKPSRSR